MNKLLCYFKAVLFCVFLCYTSKVASQNDSNSGFEYVEELIETNALQEAQTELYTQIEQFKSQQNYDTLVAYIPLVGSFKLANGDSKKAIEKALQLVQYLDQKHDPSITTDALLELSNLYFNARQYDKIYTSCTDALKYANQIQPIDSFRISKIQYNLGTASLNLGNIKTGKEHLYTSKTILENHSKKELSQLYNTYNSIGRFQASSAQIDSSTFYYKKALSTLSLMDSTEINRDYWKAIVNNNISLNFQNTGKTDQAIVYITDAIFDFQKFIDVAKDESKKLRAKRYRLSTIDNLATFYDGMGEYNRGVDLMTYSYQEKLKFLKGDDPNVVFSLVLLGHTNLNAKNLVKAAEYTDKGLSLIYKNPSNYTFLHSFTLTVRASIYEAMNDNEGAKRLYEESEALYNEQFDGNYSRDYLDALIEMSKFYTKINDSNKAIELAFKGYSYTNSDNFENNLTQFHQTLNLSNVYLGLGKHTEALKYSEEALAFFKDKKLKPKTLSDSIQNEFRKPRALLTNAKSKYILKVNKDEAFLKSILNQIEEGIRILERRKITIKTPDDLNLLIEENSDLFNFAKQIRLDLYQNTNDESYLNDLVSIHESSIYNRIRSRLNLKSNIAFSGLPNQITSREDVLKDKLRLSLNSSESTIENFIDSNSEWNQFLDSLKQNYPKYYKMRYATIEEPLTHLQSNIPEKTTIVRYLYIEDILYAFIVTKTDKKIVKLNSEHVRDGIAILAENQSDVSKTSTKLHKLYSQLWQPFSDQIQTEDVIIIPDGELFNLSFETLTPTKINTFSELATNSLLAKHNISYNYSLLLLDTPNKTIGYSKDFIAFAPEFSNQMKDEYRITVTDSISLDKTYLTLLPQPFSVDLAKKYSKVFKGDSFLNEKASKQIFTSEAKEHKIIHIGTHAESNNVSPELSRLIFAKNNSDEDNSLYTYEIYNQNLNSNLAILTACETGKPTYQAGEGMISLAHAFNYAGSESILTSLWKIDEQSSSEIINYFYDNISKGMPKGDALKHAKLDYITNAQGRTISPQYWAGLVIIGDASPIELSSSSNLLFWLFGVLIIILIAMAIRKKRNK